MSAQKDPLNVAAILSGPDVSFEVQAPQRPEAKAPGFQIRDHLTGLFNRDYMLRRLGEEIQRASRYDTPFSLAVVGVDGVERVNAVYGWSIGDQMIQGVARALYNALRKPDLVGRLGGADFIVLLPNVRRGDAVVALERARHEAASFRYGDAAVETTVSVGVVDFWGGDLMGMIEDAILLMHRARADGSGIAVDPGAPAQRAGP